MESCTFKLCLALNFGLNWKFWFSGPYLTKKGISNHKQKSDHHQWTLHIWISLSTKFQVKLTVLISWTRFALKDYFLSKTEEMNITIDFCLFELVLEPNFSLRWQFWFFGPELPKKGVSGQKKKKKKLTSPLNSAYLN